MRRFLRSTAFALLFSGPFPFPMPDIFVYASVEHPGDGVPDWVHAACCGSQDVHRLRPDQIQDTGDYYIIEGYHEPVPKFTPVRGGTGPAPNIHESQDGNYWAFYREGPTAELESNVYCLFIPMDF